MRYIKIVFTVTAAWLCLLPIVTLAQTDPPPAPTPIPTVASEATPAVAPQATATITPTAVAPQIPKVHVVQEGEVLVSIAELYETTAEAIQILNNLANPDALFVGQEILIPGAEGEPFPIVYIVDVGDTLAGIAAGYNTTISDVVALNNIVQPAVLYAGARLSLLSLTGSADPQTVNGRPHIVTQDDTLFSVAAGYGVPLADLIASNDLAYPYRLFAGQQLRIPTTEEYAHLPNGWTAIEMNPLTLVQGNTAAIYVDYLAAGEPTGRLIAPDDTVHDLRFSPYEEGFVALVGLDSFAPIGRYTLELGGVGLQRPWLPFSQDLIVSAGDYSLQQITVPDELVPLLAPEIRADEDEYLDQIFTIYRPEKSWEGVFLNPVPDAIVTARYGDSRSYNGGPVEIFHTGIDYAGAVGTPIIAPAAGTIIFTGTLNLRGETVIIDHGLGVMTAYYHLSGYDVQVGDVVTAGQQVARGGDTGLSTGPHLHWDLRVMGTAVNPVQWLERPFP